LRLAILCVAVYLVRVLDVPILTRQEELMGYPTKIQVIKRKASEQWYVNFPAAIAHAMEFDKGETVEWIIEDKGQMVLRRRHVPESAVKKTPLP
jgi:hypothetical protein